MEPAGRLSLPAEVLHHIGRFLPVADVLSCSATCHYLRHAFNDNIVWRKYLPEQFTSTLQTLEHHVYSDLCFEQRLTPLCENRQTFIKKANLINNWKNAKFVKHYSKTSYSYSSGVFNVSKVKGQAIYKDRYLFLGRFINDIESNAIEVWDINKEPVLLIVLKMNELYYECFYIVGDCLVVVECIQVKIYDIKIPGKSLSLLFSFLITENDVVFHEPVNHPGRHDERCGGWSHTVVDHYLFSNKCENEPYSCIFHIWDITNACKVGSFVPPIMGFAIHYHSHVGKNWFLRMTKQTGNDSYIFQFNIETRLFCESVCKIKKHIYHSIIYNSCCILFESSECNAEGWCDTICTVYDLFTSEIIRERRFNNAKKNHLIKSTKLVNGKIVMLCVDCFEVVDALTLETLERFPYENLSFITHQFNVYGSFFIFAANTSNIFEIWDLNKQDKTPKCINEVYTSHLYLNNSCTKLACVDWYHISVYHFL